MLDKSTYKTLCFAIVVITARGETKFFINPLLEKTHISMIL
jgi:hypothetical protein